MQQRERAVNLFVGEESPQLTWEWSMVPSPVSRTPVQLRVWDVLSCLMMEAGAPDPPSC